MTSDILFWVLAALATFLVGASKGGLPGVGILGCACFVASDFTRCGGGPVAAALRDQ